MDIDIRGVLKSGLIDYPGKIAATIFTNHCNFRCPYCQNPELALSKPTEKRIGTKEIIDYLVSRKEWIDGVCITGGEPCLHAGLVDFCRAIKENGFLVKIDTNGSNPKMLRQLIDEKLVDYVSMDMKAGRGNYSKAAGVKVDLNKIQESIDLLMQAKVDYEFRTTVVPGLFDEKEAGEIAEWLKGAKSFSLQQFRNSAKVLDQKYQNIEPFPLQKLEKFRQIMKNSFETCEIKNM